MAPTDSGRGKLRRRRSWRAAAALGLALIVAATWWETRDPLLALPQAAPMPDMVETVARHENGRLVQHVVLSDAPLGRIGLSVSLPDPMPRARLPVVMVLGGLGTGEHNIRAIADGGENAIVGYDWPLPERLPTDIGLAGVVALRRQVLEIPGQVALAWRWIAAQPWSDGDRFTVVGFSLGAVAAPALERVAALERVRIGWTVLAFGGAPLGALVEGDRRIRPAWLRPVLAWGADLLLRPVDPAVHLPHLAGRFLTLDAAQDEIVGAAAARRLVALTPEPKQSVHLPGNHVGTGPDRAAQLAAAMAAACGWLVETGAVNAPGPANPAPGANHFRCGEE